MDHTNAQTSYFVEGIQGAGKTTFVQRLADMGKEYQVFREGDFSPVEMAWCAYTTEKEYGEVLERYPALREEIRENIDYEGLVWDHPCDSDIFNGYVELMVEACCSTGENVRICGQDFPTAVVRSRFLKLGTSKRTLSPPSTMPRSP